MFMRFIMKKLLVGLLVLSSFSAMAYDGSIAAKNCANSRVSEARLIETINELNDIGIKYSVERDRSSYSDYVVTVMGRNGLIKVDLNRGVDVYFKMNKKLRKVLNSDTLNNDEVGFRITSVGRCKEF